MSVFWYLFQLFCGTENKVFGIQAVTLQVCQSMWLFIIVSIVLFIYVIKESSYISPLFPNVLQILMSKFKYRTDL